jgi:hypothetical protein
MTLLVPVHSPIVTKAVTTSQWPGRPAGSARPPLPGSPGPRPAARAQLSQPTFPQLPGRGTTSGQAGIVQHRGVAPSTTPSSPPRQPNTESRWPPAIAGPPRPTVPLTSTSNSSIKRRPITSAAIPRSGGLFEGPPLPFPDRLGRYSTLLVQLLPAEIIEFPVSYASEKSMPFVRCKSENRPFGIPAVTDTDLTIGQVRYFNAVAVGETQGALNPVRTPTRSFGYAFERRSSHVITSLIVEYYQKCATT